MQPSHSSSPALPSILADQCDDRGKRREVSVVGEAYFDVAEERKKGQTVLISPNQQVTFCDNQIRLEKLTNPEHLLWRDGIYAGDFNATPESELIRIIPEDRLLNDHLAGCLIRVQIII